MNDEPMNPCKLQKIPGPLVEVWLLHDVLPKENPEEIQRIWVQKWGIPLNYDHQIVEKLAALSIKFASALFLDNLKHVFFSVRFFVAWFSGKHHFEKIAAKSWLGNPPSRGVSCWETHLPMAFKRHEEVIAGWNLEKTEARQDAVEIRERT